MQAFAGGHALDQNFRRQSKIRAHVTNKLYNKHESSENIHEGNLTVQKGHDEDDLLSM